MWTSVVTQLGLYIFIESLWKNSLFSTCSWVCGVSHFVCSFTNELLGQLTLISEQGL